MRTSKLCSGGKGISLRHGKQLLRCLPLVGMLFATSSVNAADSPGGVKFNPGVRYSQWAINSRTNDFYANTNPFGLATYNADGSVLKKRNDSKKQLDYVPGLVSKSIIEAADYYQDFDWSKPWFLTVKEYGNTYYNDVEETGVSFDNLNATKLYIGIYNNKYATDVDKSYAKTALASVKTGFNNANKNYVIPAGTLAEKANNEVAGGWWHKKIYENQMWLDGAYMGSALLAQLTKYYGSSDNVFGSKQADWDMVTKQMNIVWNMCWNSKDKLMYHAFDATATAKAQDNNSKTWYGLSSTTPYVFHSYAYWGRADAWYLYALVDVLEAMKADGQESTNNYTTLKSHLVELAAGIAARQDKTTGGWYQLLDKDASFKSTKYNGSSMDDANYIETSATSLFSAALFKAVRLGLLSDSYKTVAKNAFEGLVKNFVTYDNDGGIQIWGSCKSAGLGGSKYRDGSNEYYLSGSDVTMVKKGETTEGKVLGGFIMAATEYERAYQNQDSKQILFAKDLAPKYDFSTTAGSLDATAYGEETPSYQWYKGDGTAAVAVANATSATFSPTESGEYYCEATANGKTIKTSTTTVTAKSATEGGEENKGETTTETVFSLTMNANENASIPKGETSLTNYAQITGGSASVGNTKDKEGQMIADGNITFTDKGTQYVKITLVKALANGDVIKITTTGKKIYATKEYPSSNETNNIAKSPYTVDDNLSGATTLYLRSADNGKTISSITITRTVTKEKLTATFDPNSVTATVGDASVAVPPLTVKAGETTLTPTTDYNVSYSSKNVDVVRVDNGTTLVPVAKGNADITATITPVDETKYNEITAKFTVTVNEKQEVVAGDVYKWNTVGTYTYQGDIKESNGTIRFASNYSNKAYMTIKPASGGFKVGDVVTITGHCDSKNRSGIELHATADGNSIFMTPVLAKSDAGDATYTFTITEDCDALYLGRFGGGTTYVTALSVNRGAATSKTRLAASFAGGNSISVVKKADNQTITLPALTVTANGKALETSAYSVDFKSNDDAVVKYNADNIVSIVGKGIATITATVTPKDDAKYEGCTATYQITVTDPFSLKISTADITINTTDADYKKPIISVFDKDDKQLPADNYTLSYKVVSGDVVFVKDGSLVVTGTPYNWKEGVATIEVTATPTDAFNINGEYAAGKLTFTYEVNKGKRNPKFLENFSGITINIGKGNKRTITVPVVYDGEDVSEYFDYTYTSSNTSAGKTVTNGSALTFTAAKSEGTTVITVAATPKKAATADDKDYSEDWNEPTKLTFNIKVDDFGTTTVVVNPTEYNMTTGQIKELPDVIVTHNGVELDDNAYDVNWITSSPGVVRVTADGRLEAVSEGSKVSVRAVVTGTNLESTTALFTVNVDDPNVYRVKKGETFEKYAVRTDQNHNVEVSLGGWMFKNTKPIADNIKKDESLGDGNWASTAIDGTTITGFSNYIGAAKKNPIANARQEDGSNAQPMSTSLYDATLAGQGSIIDPMFNVPASGSYLVFAPKTNGTINAHIFQNGVFDTDSKGPQYRPQRRVMVVDEAGNVVSTEALIEAVTAKPSGFNENTANLSKWKWDLKEGTTIDEEMVKSHFKGDGIKAFNFTVDGFANMVAESILPYDIVKNEALKNEALKDMKGINGWCVLADAPVTYTFHVQAGKTYYLYNFGSRIGFYGFSFEEDNDIVVDPVVYEQAVDKTIEKTAAGHSATVSIDRVFKGGQWNAAVLPFSLNKQQVDEIFGQTYGNGNWNENATQILYFDRVEGNTIYFMRHAYNTIVAGKPFLIRPAKTGDILINTNELENYKYVTIENDEPADWCNGNDGSYVWRSSYNPMTISMNDYYISAKDGKLYQRENKDLAAKGFRGFLHVNGSQKNTLRVAMGSKENDDNSTTVIEGIEMDSDGNIITTLENGKVYNVNGQVVADDSKSFSSLSSGVYIINGKKYIK
ncbi:glycoside hydrolase family 88 protein [uncultured Prevotella sp.]|uniref:glycoside hydrolase family 88 protein n=1 Tax=uncultured Prevotella sp. TaxID=159272 RepID=UPI0026364E23|nr:glycoside hydrolase family 88 protein [uncultured Prevotella sp.]